MHRRFKKAKGVVGVTDQASKNTADKLKKRFA
jgi:hypothetical protein